ncbi:solute carrier family 35 member G1-like protein [Dinothrombium tinctorium]|uniref:Solute carrier family 35 member G1-like protein n=1 Tax=Dinothrombium tinctorium TaxID=1965070 RepID=A0A3S3QPQ1_9ACAR|nr:solute carrier family 35 member G1-like protein [Dinothrombium tinctorium]RWS12054.1 solute carrier family 35 member G1-like protein [Dinothrombium tinctorium]
MTASPTDVESLKKEQRTLFEKLSGIPAIGIVFALLSGFFFATGTLIVKLVVDMHPIELVVIRSLVQLIVYSVVVLYTRDSLLGAKGERWALVSRCFWGFFSVAFSYMALRYIPLGDSSAITFSSPVFVAVIARIFLKEPIGFFHVITMCATIGGVILIDRPTFLFGSEAALHETDRLIGTLLALGGAIGGASAFVSIRKLQKTSSPVVIFWFSLYVIVVGMIILVILDSLTMPLGLETYMWLLLMGLCGTFGQLCLTIAFKLEEAGPVSLARTIDIVVAFIYQVAILNETVVWTSLLGAIIVLSSVVVTAIRKWYIQKPQAFEAIFPFLKHSKRKETLGDKSVPTMSQIVPSEIKIANTASSSQAP